MKPVSDIVRMILRDVERRGDAAICDMARRFDNVRLRPAQLLVGRAELRAAREKVSPSFVKSLKECAKNIEAFAQLEKARLTRSWTHQQGSVQVGQLIRPVESVGLYIPGGRYPYPSTVLMTVIPARVAGVKRVIMATPPKNLTPEVLTAAVMAGCETIYRAGGAGAVAALAYGTQTLPAVDFIAGPGNQYVMEAKRQVFGQVGIDSLAGPSEVVIIADESTKVEEVELDLQAQAEHDPESQSVLLATDQRLIREVRKRLSRALAQRVKLQYVPSLAKAAEAANALAPEHLEILIKRAERILPLIKHAGAIFLGPATPAALGDYVAGPSHVLPTDRSARFSSGLSVATFMKRSSVVGFQAQPTEKPRWEAALVMAQTEGMEYHADSLRCRMAS